MLSRTKLVQLAKKWQRMAVLGRRRLSFERKQLFLGFLQSSESFLIVTLANALACPLAEKGHFVVYTIDQKWFMIPLDYLNTRIVMQLFQLSEEEFGYTVDGPITLPCEVALMEYAIDLVKGGVSEEAERALLGSVLLPCHHSCSAQSNLGIISQQFEVCRF